MKSVLIVIPTYNEKDNITELLSEVFKSVPQVNVLIVDDNSPDGTGKIVDDLVANNTYNDRLFVMHRSGKLGLGTAYIQGFQWGMQRGYELLFSMDADFSHDPKYLPEMIALAENNDLVIGSRYVKGGGTQNWGFIRRLISKGGSLYARIVLLANVHDFTGGFNCYHKNFLERLNLDTVFSKGYCFQIEMKFRHVLMKAKIKEMPIIFCDRVNGKSKMSSNIFKEAVINVLRLSLMRGKIKNMMKNGIGDD